MYYLPGGVGMRRLKNGAVARSMADATTAGVARVRRRPGEVRPLLLATARQVFEEKGYARATTREITVRANVAETLLFRNFGSKANLFAEAVLLPLAEFFRDWVRRFTAQEASVDVQSSMYEFNRTLYEMARANRGLLLTFFATAVFEPEALAASDAIATISDALDELATASGGELARLGIDTRDYDIVTSSRAVVGMILATALFESIIVLSPSHARTQEEVLHELTRQILFGGLNQRPAFVDGPAASTNNGAAANAPTRQVSTRKGSTVAATASGSSSQKK
jgi:AcrR family transcriptional regulator